MGDNRDSRETLALDRLYRQYKDSSGKPRLLVLFGGSQDERPNLTTNFTENDQRVFSLFLDARFEEAMELFKQNVLNMSQEIQARDQIVMSKVADCIEQEGPLAIFLLFGTGHAGLYYQLKRLENGDISVRRRFLDRIEDTKVFWYDPFSAIERKVRYRGPDSPTEIEWKRALIGTIMLQVLNFVNKTMTYQQMIKIASISARMFKTIEDVERFEEEARSAGIIAALEKLGT